MGLTPNHTSKAAGISSASVFVPPYNAAMPSTIKNRLELNDFLEFALII
jgi:hypothetical protein